MRSAIPILRQSEQNSDQCARRAQGELAAQHEDVTLAEAPRDGLVHVGIVAHERELRTSTVEDRW